MNTALETITQKLLSTGMDQEEVDGLLARFLEEEAFDYVSTVASALKKYLAENDGTFVS